MISQRRYDGRWRRVFTWRPVRLEDEWDGYTLVVRHAWLHWVERRSAHYALLDEGLTTYRLPRCRGPDTAPTPRPLAKHEPAGANR